jgi:hypothetical protein
MYRHVQCSYPQYIKDTGYHVPDAMWLFRHTVKRPEFLPKIVEVRVVVGQLKILGAGLRMKTLSKGQLSICHEP